MRILPELKSGFLYKLGQLLLKVHSKKKIYAFSYQVQFDSFHYSTLCKLNASVAKKNSQQLAISL